MKLTDINVNEVLKIEQEPIIVYQELEKIGAEVDKFLESFDIDNIEITEDNRSMVRGERTQIRKIMKEFEDRRLNVRRAILEPYDQFNELYQEHIGEKFKLADKQLKSLLDEIEVELLEEKKNGFLDKFNKLKEEHDLDFVSFDQVDTKITLSSTLKSTEEDIDNFFKKVVGDLAIIETQPEDNDRRIRIQAMYKETLDITRSITEVNESIDRELAIKEQQEQARLKAEQDAIQKELEESQATKEVKQEPTVTEEVEEVVAEPKEKTVESKFMVKGTMEEIVALVQYMKANNLDYKNID